MTSADEILLDKAEKSTKRGKITERPQLIILMGLPGSGKSYVSFYLHDKYGFTILSGENITYTLFGTEKCSTDEYALAYKILRQLAVKLLADGYSIVIDGTNLKYEFRRQIYNEVSCRSTKLIYLKVDDKIALDRISKRNNSCSIDTFNSFKSQIEEPLPSEKAIVLKSDDRILNNIDKILCES